jgi:hypothetical protein
MQQTEALRWNLNREKKTGPWRPVFMFSGNCLFVVFDLFEVNVSDLVIGTARSLL